MKADLDRLMAGRELQAVVVVGDELYSAERDYLGNGARVTGGLVVKLRGAAPVLIVNPMEIEEARSSGLEAISWQELDWAQLLQEAEGERERALAGLWGRALQRLDVPPGRIGIYGSAAAQNLIELLPELQALEGYEFCGERGMTLFDEAAMTRDADELERIRRVAAGHQRHPARDLGLHRRPSGPGRPGRRCGRPAADRRRPAPFYPPYPAGA